MRIQDEAGQIWCRERGRDSELDPCLISVGAKGAESGSEERQIRRPFHPDVQFLRIKQWMAVIGAEIGKQIRGRDAFN
jgi:hypothetical protein